MILFIHTIQLVGGIFFAFFAAEDEEGNAMSIPAWTFAAFLQPLISMLFYVHSYGLLNLAIERDVDQDIVEMNIRLTYSQNHVPNWLLQQMICLERLDGRAHGLPFNLIPSVEMSRRLTGNTMTAVTLLFPYLLSIIHQLGAELVVLREYDIND